MKRFLELAREVLLKASHQQFLQIKAFQKFPYKEDIGTYGKQKYVTFVKVITGLKETWCTSLNMHKLRQRKTLGYPSLCHVCNHLCKSRQRKRAQLHYCKTHFLSLFFFLKLVHKLLQ